MFLRSFRPVLYLAPQLLLAASALALLLLPGGHASASHGSQPTIPLVAIDMEPSVPAANTGTTIGAGGAGVDAGDVQQALGLPATAFGSPFQIDILVDHVPDAPEGVFGIGGELLYDPALLNVVGYTTTTGIVGEALHLQGPDTRFDSNDSTPDADGSFRLDTYDLSGSDESGPGTAIRITLVCLGSGVAQLSITDQSTGGGDHLGVIGPAGAITYPVVDEHEAVVFCNTTVDYADISVATATSQAPPNATLGVPFDITVDGTIFNGGPRYPTGVDATTVLNMPADCSAAGGNTRSVAGISLATPDVYALPTQTFSVTCTSPSFHSFVGVVSAAINEPGVYQVGTPQRSSSETVTAVTQTGDWSIGGAAIQQSFEAYCPAANPAAGTCPGVTLPRMQIGTDYAVTVQSTVNNTGLSALALTDAISFSAVQSPAGIPATCTATPSWRAVQVNVAAQASSPVSESFTVRCTTDSFANPAAPQSILLTFGQIVDGGIHLIDSGNPGDNSAQTTLQVWVTRPFAPSFSVLEDETTPSDVIPAPLPNEDCAIPFPAGIPCEQMDVFSIPAGNAAATGVGMATVTVPSAPITIASGHLGQLGATNGTVVGALGIQHSLNFGPGCTTNAFNLPYGAATLKDGALPASTAGWDDDGDGLTDEDPPGNGDEDSDSATDEDGAYTWVLGDEGPNTNASTPAGMSDVAAFPTKLFASAAVQQAIANGWMLWARYVSLVPGVNSSLNILVFRTGTSYELIPVWGNPTMPIPPNVWCTPSSVQVDYLGSTTDVGSGQLVVLRKCNQIGSHTISAQFTRLDTGDTSTATSDLVCTQDPDTDADGIADQYDNCPDVPNADQANTDLDQYGNACDTEGPDGNNAGLGGSDDCYDTLDNDDDGLTDGLEPTCDTDDDGVPEAVDACVGTVVGETVDPDGCSQAQVDSDLDGACDPGRTSTLCTGDDNCPGTPNADQANGDSDGRGNACDNCPTTTNPSQRDDDSDSIGTACDTEGPSSNTNGQGDADDCLDGIDNDGDGPIDNRDPGCNPLADGDGDGVGDDFDVCPGLVEDLDGYQDSDGCPDPDNDADAICDAGQSNVSCTGMDLGRYIWSLPLVSPIDCRNTAEDFDGFHDDDGCPEPDNDLDGFPDGTDECPGTDYTAGPDGVADSGDEPLGSLSVPIQTKEDYDGVIDFDGCHDSPTDDYDGDALTDENEAQIYFTDPVDKDTDDDGVEDGVDGLNSRGDLGTAASDYFTDRDGGTTFGRIVSRGTAAPSVRDAPDPAGVRIRVTNVGVMTVEVCGLETLTLDTGDDVAVTCGSSTVSVVRGSVTAKAGSLRITMGTGVTATLEESGGGYVVTNAAFSTGNVVVNGFAVTPGTAQPDGDGDGFLNARETFVGTSATAACSVTQDVDDEPTDALPTDMNDDQRTNTLDVGRYVGRLNKISPDPLYSVRLDLNGDGRINTLDAGLFVPLLNVACSP